MSKLNSSKINFNKNDFLVEVSVDDGKNQISEEDLIKNRAQNEIELQIQNAQNEANKIVESAVSEAKSEAQSILENAQNEAQKITEEAKLQAQNMLDEANAGKNELLVNAQTEIETASQEAAKKGYEEGYKDAQEKFFEENEEKIKAFNDFCANQNIVRDKILKNASREILNIIENISKVVLLKEVDSQTLDKIIKNTISFFDKKENITIVLSEKYAKLLYELQKKEADIELNFEDFKQYEGFEVVYNKELPEDTIIVENPKERFCASITQQIDKIIREIHDNTQNGNIDIEEYDETKSAE